MKQLPLLPLVLVGILLVSSFTAIAAKPETPPGQLKEKHQKNPDAPGQWKKINTYANQSDFVDAVHMRIWNRLQSFGVMPPGLMKLLMHLLEIPDGDTDEPPDELEEPPEEETEDLEEEIPEEEPEDPP